EPDITYGAPGDRGRGAIWVQLESIPVIDTHAHPFPPEQTAISQQRLRDAMSVALRTETPPENDSMLLSRMVLKGLAKLLNCPPTWEAVMARRNEAAEAGVEDYHRLLFDDANVGMV